MPYSTTYNNPDWHRLWINTATLSGAFVGTLLVLECLPEDATSWNRAELQDVPLFKRWHNHVIKKGPEWDHDNWVFNYALHPYAGAAYFMAARSCGFNFYQSMLYSACVSTIEWEFGIEALWKDPQYKIFSSLHWLAARLVNVSTSSNVILFLMDIPYAVQE